MSFTSEVKEELAHVRPVCSHCERATLAAVVRVHGSLYFSGSGSYRLEVITDSSNVARFVKTQLSDLYQLHVDIVIRRSVLHKTPNYLLEIPAQERLNGALVDLGILDSQGGLLMDLLPSLVEKDCCAAAYIRGVFLGSGFISNPQGSLHFEMSFNSESFARSAIEILGRRDIPAKLTKRRNSYVVYLKSGDYISDFLAFSGAHQCALKFEQTRLVKSISNDVNRVTNAELANSKRSVNASFELIKTIEYLQESGNFSKMPPALREVAYLRMQNPGASLKALGELAKPPLSKSAVAHRVRRIEEFAAACKKKS